MDRGSFPAEIDELVVAVNTMRSDGAAPTIAMKLSLASADRVTEALLVT